MMRVARGGEFFEETYVRVAKASTDREQSGAAAGLACIV
jgi:hypothetical protein